MAGTRRRPLIPDRRAALLLGYGGIVVGSWALWEAYEMRGKKRPFLTKFLPGA
jgi:hypothetical protein